MISTLGGILDEMEQGVYNFTKDGKCSGCGECCSNYLPISSSEKKEIKRYIEKNGIKECKHNAYFLAKQPEMDMTCPFLDDSKKDKKCTIYAVRPKICRVFQCNIPPSEIKENKIAFMQTHEPVDMRAEFFGEESIFEKIFKGAMFY